MENALTDLAAYFFLVATSTGQKSLRTRRAPAARGSRADARKRLCNPRRGLWALVHPSFMAWLAPSAQSVDQEAAPMSRRALERVSLRPRAHRAPVTDEGGRPAIPLGVHPVGGLRQRVGRD